MLRSIKAFLGRMFGGTDSSRNEKLEKLQRLIGYQFKDKDRLIEALTHKSILGERKDETHQSTYERLEFLGDSVLSLVTSDFLIRHFPTENEGQLTKKKSLLVSKTILSKKAEALGLKEFFILSENAVKGGVADQESVQSEVLEAIIGAIYLDRGIGEARRFILSRILDDVEVQLVDRDHINYKSDLQELSQARFKSYPLYLIKTTIGPEHDKIFVIEVKIGSEIFGIGRGKSKKDAEQMAAKEALSKLR